MTTLNFPASPALNQQYTANGSTWTWDGTSWLAYNGPASGYSGYSGYSGSSSSNATTLNTTSTSSASTFYVGFMSTNGGNLQTVYNSGNLYYIPSTGALTATSHVSSSDERLKTNWQGLPVDFIEQLANTKSGKFTRIESGNQEVGVSAQSLQKTLPEAVIENDAGMLAVNYGGASLVSVIELAKEIVKLRQEIKELKDAKI
jgi:hypothetical protein